MSIDNKSSDSSGLLPEDVDELFNQFSTQDIMYIEDVLRADCSQPLESTPLDPMVPETDHPSQRETEPDLTLLCVKHSSTDDAPGPSVEEPITEVETLPDDQHRAEEQAKHLPENEATKKRRIPLKKERGGRQRGALHECLQCHKTFKQLGHLRNHNRLHTGERPFICAICGKSFTQSGHLSVHVNAHTDAKPYKCQYCPKAFNQSGHLRNHERLHFGIRPYRCVHCARSFTQSGHLVNHQRIHEGVKPYSCPTCGKCFTQSGHVTVHLKVHQRN